MTGATTTGGRSIPGTTPTRRLRHRCTDLAKLTIDHIPGHTRTNTEPFDDWPIIELVTDPIDETMSLDDFEDLARTHWIDLLLLARQMAKLSPPAV